MVTPGRVPWEDANVSFPANLGITWWESLVRPSAFYRAVDWDGPFSRPLLYWLLVWIGGGALSLLWAPAELEALALILGADGAVDGRLLQLLNFFMSPFAALMALAVATGLHHVSSVLLAPARRGVEATGRVVCYAAGPLILGSIPVPGLLDWLVTVGLWAWIAVLLVTGFREAHRATTPRAVGIVAIPMVVIGVLTFGFVLLIAVVMASLPELLP